MPTLCALMGVDVPAQCDGYPLTPFLEPDSFLFGQYYSAEPRNRSHVSDPALDDLLVRLGPYRRSLALPDSLRRRDIEGARLRDGVLRITFVADAAPSAAPPATRATK